MPRIAWTPQAVDIAQVDMITVSGTWAAADEFTLTMAGNSVKVIIGADTATTDIATIISRTINATSRTDNLLGDEERDIGGQQIPEFTDVSAAVSAADTSVVLVTGNTRGQPFSGTGYTDGLSVSETTAGSGALAITNDGATSNESVRPTGKNWIDNANNWSSGSAPANDDTMVFQNSDISALYAIDQSSLTTLKIEVDQSFRGNIGLPIVNRAATTNYVEWRTRFLEAGWDTDPGDNQIGGGNGPGSQLINIDMGSVAANFTIFNSGTPAAGQRHAINLQGGSSAVVDIRRGSVSLGDDAGTGTTSIANLQVSTASAEINSADVYMSSEVTIGVSISKNGGNLEINNTSGGTIPQLTTKSGTLLIRGNVIIDNLNMAGTSVTVWENLGDINTSLSLRDSAVWDLSTDIRDLSMSLVPNVIEIYSADVIIRDPHGRIPDGTVFDFNNVPVTVNKIRLGENRKITVAATT